MILQQLNWRVRASCRDVDPDRLFVKGADQRKVKMVCLSCPVRTECLAEALDKRIEFGVWGGMTERERRSLLRRRPDVLSWHALLNAARRQHEAVIHADCLVDATEDDPRDDDIDDDIMVA
jgi:WhiB family redox-sensing transcriptional regulator